MSDDDVRYVGILLEQIRDQNQAVLELLKDIPTRTEFGALKQDVADLNQDVKVIKAAVMDMGKQLADHEHRIIRLEAA